MEDEQIDLESDAAIPAAPWHNSDTVAASFAFASSLASAAADYFTALSNLSQGQAMQEWAEDEKADLIEDTIGTIFGLRESGGDGDD